MISPKLDCHGSLDKTDDDTIKELAEWNDVIVNCRKALAKHIKQEAGRNTISMKKEHQKKMIREMIKITADMAV